jgi:ABC-type sugar transport system ATPase subunit
MIKAVEENINITMLDRFALALGFLNFKTLGRNASRLSRDLQIKTPSLNQLVMYLSGGNQQKVMIAKWLARDLEIFIFDEPTRGVDVGAKSEIHKLLTDLKNQGKAIVVISSELPEILRVSDRIVTMSQGKIGLEFSREEATEEKILQCLHAEIAGP